MTTYMIHNNGQPVSIGTVIADPLPQGLTATALSDTDAARLLTGGWQWNPATLAVDIEPAPVPDPLGDIAAELPAATLEEVNDLLAQVLSTLGGN
jgi:hypothetical protein